MNERILVVSDDPQTRKLLKGSLGYRGYRVAVSRELNAAEKASETRPGLMIMELVQSGEDGGVFLKRIQESYGAPALLLIENGHTEQLFREADASRVRVLLKPYLLEELLEEVEAILSSAIGDFKLMMYSDLVLDTGARTVTRGNKSLDLTAREYELLDYMMRRKGEELTRSEILEQVWGREFKGHTNVLEVYIRYLRLKLESGGGERLIHNVRGVGYVLRDET